MAPIPPLVAPGPALTAAQRQRYARHLTLPDVGDLGQRRLANARVLCVGAGGLGSPILLYLAAAGVGTVGVVDGDTVDLSNLQRQVVHGAAAVGRRKTDSAAARVADLNGDVAVLRHATALDRDNALDVLARYDLVVDGSDNFATRYLVNDAAALLGKPYVWGSVQRFAGQVAVFWAGHGPCYRCLFPQPPPPGAVPSCAEGGVLGALCGVVGSLQATEALKLITGVGSPLLGSLLLYDAKEVSHQRITVHPDPDCVLCGPGATLTELLPDYPAFCGTAAAPGVDLAELAARQAAGAVVVDVREPVEYAAGHLDGARLLPLGEIRAGRTPPPGRAAVLYCQSGRRSAEALRLLRAAGHPDVVHLAGGLDAAPR